MSSFKTVFRTPYFTIQKSSILHDSKHPYYRMCTDDLAIICVLDECDRFLLVQQWRPNIECQTLEFPAGAIESEESHFQAATRELEEETGHTAHLLYLGPCRLMMNRLISREHLFFGVGATAVENRLKEPNIQIKKIHRKRFIKLVNDGQFEQIAALGLLARASLTLDIDVFTASFKDIEAAFLRIKDS